MCQVAHLSSLTQMSSHRSLSQMMDGAPEHGHAPHHAGHVPRVHEVKHRPVLGVRERPAISAVSGLAIVPVPVTVHDDLDIIGYLHLHHHQ